MVRNTSYPNTYLSTVSILYLEGLITTTHYDEYIADTSTSALAVVTCMTRYIQPQNVFWLRNGEPLSIDGLEYEMTEDLRSQTNSYYNHSLIIRDILGLINSPEYTCYIENTDSVLNSTVSVKTNLAGNHYWFNYKCYISPCILQFMWRQKLLSPL